MRKKKYVYTITGIRFGYKYANRHRSKDGYYHSYRARTSKAQDKYFTILDQRVWGCCDSLDEAKKTVTKYASEWILENMYYTWVVIERFEMSGVCFGIPKEWWFHWEGDEATGKYKPAKKPEQYDGIINFAMG